MNKKYAIRKIDKMVVVITSMRSFVMRRGGTKVRCVEYEETSGYQSGRIYKTPILDFKENFVLVDQENAKILYGR